MLRFHQELITQKTSNLIEEGYKCFYGVVNVEVVKLICLVV